MVLDEGPYCHRPFDAEVLSKEPIDSNDVLMKSSRLGPKADAYLTYQETYRCKHCTKTWTRIQGEKVGLSPEYVQTSTEKSEYDTDVEEEKAREDARNEP
jgi:hypothetical protein